MRNPAPIPESACHALGRHISRIVLVYAAFAGLWILVSDQAVAWLFREPASITLASTFKGVAFVLVTSLLLYGLLHQLARTSSSAPARQEPAPPAKMALPFVLLVAALLALTVVAISHTYSFQRDKSVARLQAIADLKAQQIADWLKERRQDAEFLRGSRYLADNYRRWQEAGDPASRKNLLERLEQLRQNRGFAAVTLLDAQGQPLWRSARGPEVAAPILQAAALKASGSGQMQRVGPYRDLRGNPRLDFVAPLALAGTKAPLVVLHSDPQDWLYRTLQTWPVPNLSGEALLFRREGGEVLFLNELRHRPGAALTLRVSLARKHMLAAQVLNGAYQPGKLLEGEDYRGVAVLGVAQAIPGTDWFLMTKQDRVELYEDATRDALWMGLAGLLAVFMAAAGFYVLRQRQQLALSDGIRDAQAERLRALRLLAAISDGSDAAIFAKDREGRYILFNRAAGEFVGQPPEAVLGQDDHALFPPEQAEQLIGYGQDVIAADQIITREEVLTTTAGERVFLGTKGPLRDEEGQVIGIFGISRDITERNRVEVALRESEAMFRALTASAQDAILMIDGQGLITFWNAAAERMFGYTEAEALGQRMHQLIAPPRYHAESARGLFQFGGDGDGAMVGKTIELVGRRKDGTEIPVELSLSTFRMHGEFGAAGILRDISERKRNEADMLSRNQELERFNRATIGRELDMVVLKQQVNALSRELGREPPYALSFLAEPEA